MEMTRIAKLTGRVVVKETIQLNLILSCCVRGNVLEQSRDNCVICLPLQVTWALEINKHDATTNHMKWELKHKCIQKFGFKRDLGLLCPHSVAVVAFGPLRCYETLFSNRLRGPETLHICAT